jgi:four helix bundle protein
VNKSNIAYRGFKDLKVYQLSYALAKEIFIITKDFPRDEKYSLTDQIRRSSRAIPSIIAEAWYRRKYPKSFSNKLIEASGEAGETEVWLDFSLDHNYITQEKHIYFVGKYSEVSRMLNSIINQPEKFCLTSSI